MEAHRESSAQRQNRSLRRSHHLLLSSTSALVAAYALCSYLHHGVLTTSQIVRPPPLVEPEQPPTRPQPHDTFLQTKRRLSENQNKAPNDHSNDKLRHRSSDIPRVLSLAKRPPPNPDRGGTPFRVLLVTTTLSEYDKGTRGTTRNYDRLWHVMLPPLVDAVSSMTSRGWEVDVYLVLGYDLRPERRKLIDDALQAAAAGDSKRGVGLEVWEDAIPFYYENTFNKRPREGQSLVNGDHALSRQHRFVLRDKLSFYDFFVCFVSGDVFFLASIVLRRNVAMCVFFA
mmetsp:Transcript_20670/g.39863  ORF Transcript_20670/g.39863 Transcript_20670/m.39863 type:complete len:285 (-) Transcript_20670:842-1696(-)